MANIYEPSDDSFFFSEFLEKYLKELEGEIEYLDLGTGSGILAKTASKILEKSEIIVTDINLKAVELLRKKGFNSIQSNLFSNINSKFDLITFNAPYLPRDDREPKNSRIATTGGERGDEISIEFLEQARKHLNPEGKILLLISSLTPQDRIAKFGPQEVARKKIFMEDLIILEFSNSQS